MTSMRPNVPPPDERIQGAYELLDYLAECPWSNQIDYTRQYAAASLEEAVATLFNTPHHRYLLLALEAEVEPREVDDETVLSLGGSALARALQEVRGITTWNQLQAALKQTTGVSDLKRMNGARPVPTRTGQPIPVTYSRVPDEPFVTLTSESVSKQISVYGGPPEKAAQHKLMQFVRVSVTEQLLQAAQVDPDASVIVSRLVRQACRQVGQPERSVAMMGSTKLWFDTRLTIRGIQLFISTRRHVHYGSEYSLNPSVAITCDIPAVTA